MFLSGQIKEVYELLNANYVEDDDAMFRFDYSVAFLHWCVYIRRTIRITYPCVEFLVQKYGDCF